MGSRGPLKAPAVLQLVRGDPRQRGKAALAAAADAGIQAPSGVPEVANFMRYGGSGPKLAMLAREEWDRITPHLLKIGLLSVLDRAALTNYCFYWALDCYAAEKLVELGDAGLVESTQSGFKQMGAWLQIKNRASMMSKQFLAEFGLSPASRGRVSASDPQGDLPGIEGKPTEGGWGGMSLDPPPSAN